MRVAEKYTVQYRTIESTLLLVLLISAACFAADAYSAVAGAVAETDKFLHVLSNVVENVSSLDKTEKILKEKIVEMPAAEYLLRTNSQGKIISKVTPGGVEKRTFRNIGNQGWHRGTELTRQPYYGMVRSGKKPYMFWARPLSGKNNKYGGSLVAKINLKDFFAHCAETEKIEFSISRRGVVVFSNLKSSGTMTRPLFIPGIDGLVLAYNSDGAAVDLEPLTAKVDAFKVDTAEKIDTMQEEEVPDPEKIVSSRSILIGKIVLYAALVLLAVSLGIIAFYLVRQSREKNRKIMDAIDRGEL